MSELDTNWKSLGLDYGPGQNAFVGWRYKPAPVEIEVKVRRRTPEKRTPQRRASQEAYAKSALGRAAKQRSNLKQKAMRVNKPNSIEMLTQKDLDKRAALTGSSPRNYIDR